MRPLAAVVVRIAGCYGDCRRAARPEQYFFDQSLGDFQEELANARDQGKQGVFCFSKWTNVRSVIA